MIDWLLHEGRPYKFILTKAGWATDGSPFGPHVGPPKWWARLDFLQSPPGANSSNEVAGRHHQSLFYVIAVSFLTRDLFEG